MYKENSQLALPDHDAIIQRTVGDLDDIIAGAESSMSPVTLTEGLVDVNNRADAEKARSSLYRLYGKDRLELFLHDK